MKLPPPLTLSIFHRVTVLQPRLARATLRSHPAAIRRPALPSSRLALPEGASSSLPSSWLGFCWRLYPANEHRAPIFFYRRHARYQRIVPSTRLLLPLPPPHSPRLPIPSLSSRKHARRVVSATSEIASALSGSINCPSPEAHSNSPRMRIDGDARFSIKADRLWSVS